MKAKSVTDLNDTDLSELAQKFELTPLQILHCLKKFQREQEELEASNSSDFSLADKDGNLFDFDESKPASQKDSKKLMLVRALRQLPNFKGTKSEVFKQVKAIYELEITKNSTLHNTLEQALCKHFHKIPCEIMLNKAQDFTQFVIGKNPTMKDMIIASLLKLKDMRGDLRQLKLQMLELFGDKLSEDVKEETMTTLSNLYQFDSSRAQQLQLQTQKWEANMQKTISRFKSIFMKTKPVFSLRNPLSLSSLRAERQMLSQNEECSQMSVVSLEKSNQAVT